MLSVPLAMGLGFTVLATSFLSGLFGMAGGMVLMGILLTILPVSTGCCFTALRRRHPMAGGHGSGGDTWRGTS